MDDAKKDVDCLNDRSKTLEETVDDLGGENAPIKEKTKEINDRLKDLDEQCRKRRKDVTKKIKVLEQFVATKNEVEAWYATNAGRLTKVGPTGTKPEEVTEQLNVLEVIAYLGGKRIKLLLW